MKTVTIEAFLTWAFTQELCKLGGGDGLSGVGLSNWSVTRDMAVLGTIIDRSPNIYGVVPGFVGEGDPHPDAIAAGDAVRALDDVGFDIPEGWNPFPEWPDEHGLVAAEVSRVVGEVRLKGERLTGRYLVTLVTRAAILGHGTDWTCAYPGARMVSVNGKPGWFIKRRAKDAFGRAYEYEADGRDHVRHRPKKGAYRKYELKSSVRGAVLSRLDWQLWQDALAKLAESLEGRLQSHRISGFVPDRHPWSRRKRSAEMELSP